MVDFIRPDQLTPEEELAEIATWFGWSPSDGAGPKPGSVLVAVSDLMSAIDRATSDSLRIRRSLDLEIVCTSDEQ